MKEIEQVTEIINRQQEGKAKYSPVYQVGEQLKSIAKTVPNAAEILLNDLAVPEMSIEAAEKKIKARADEIHKEIKGNGACVPPDEAHKILCEFYGIPIETNSETFTNLTEKPKKHINLVDFM